jgi:hypothetical protein
MSKHSEHEKNESRAWLLEHLRPGDKVYSILDHVSSSGMSRDIRFLIARHDAKRGVYFVHLNYHMQILLDYPQAKRGDGLRVGGCGMDMGFHVVYGLGNALWPHGTKKPHGTRNGKPDSEGGYALKHAWL